MMRIQARWAAHWLRYALRACAVIGLLAATMVLVPGAAWSQTPDRLDLRPFRARVDDLLFQYGLQHDRLALLLYSTRSGIYLYQHNIHRPMIAASNAKLVTTYAALQVLSPDYRWRTRFYLVEEQNDAQGPARQGLLVQGSGDPTLTAADLDRIALMLKGAGLRRLDGGIYLDGRRFDEVMFPGSWGDVSKGEPWFAPVSPFIVEKNVIDFVIATRPDRQGFEVLTRTPGFDVISALKPTEQEKPNIRVEQRWHADGATFTLVGSLAPSPNPYNFSAAVERPRVHFYRQLRASLRRARIGGAMPLRLAGPLPPHRQLLYTQLSPPLREVIVEVNKHSSNLAAEVLLRTMGLYENSHGVSTEDGLAVLRRVMKREFYQSAAELVMVDGSGLSRKARISALLMVRLLNRVREEFTIRPEFISSLSVALTDGTLQFRSYPWRMKGRLRAKSGTLAAVSNLSGYLQLEHDVIIFSFLINDEERHFLELQQAQDQVVAGIYGALLALEPQLPMP